MSANTQTNDMMELKPDPLVALSDMTGYMMIQQNGQRKYGPPPNWGNRPPPPKGSEIFVGKLPRDCYEDELVPLFNRIGRIYEMRLMMDFSGTNRGYAFVMYTCVEDAKRAVAQLNNYQVRPNKFLGVLKSVDNCRLFVGGIPKNQTRDEILKEMSKITEGVVDVILYNSPRDKTKNRGFAFIEYESHRAAAIARRKLIPGRIQLWGQTIMVDWAEPEPDVDEDIMSKVKVLYVRNLMESTTEELIKSVFSRNRDGCIEKVKKLRDFAFIHFLRREDAQDAMLQLNGKDLDGSIIEVTWAKPADKSGNRNRRVVPMGPMHAYGYSLGDHVPGQMMQYAAPTQMVIPSAGRGSYGIRYRTRGRGAAGLRGARGGYFGSMGPGHSEFRLYDLPPGMHVLPTNAVPLRQAKLPHQHLADICQKNNWGEPQYQIQGPPGHHGSGNGNEMQLFACKVTIQGLGTYSIMPKLCRSMEDARQNAAQHVIHALPNDTKSSYDVSSDNSPVTSSSSSPLSRSPVNREYRGSDPNYFATIGQDNDGAVDQRLGRDSNFDMSSFYDFLHPGYPIAAAGGPHF